MYIRVQSIQSSIYAKSTIPTKYNKTDTCITVKSFFERKHLRKCRKKHIYLCTFQSQNRWMVTSKHYSLYIFYTHSVHMQQKEDFDSVGSFVYNNISQWRQVRDHRLGAFGGTGNLRKSRLDLTSDRVRFGIRPIVGRRLESVRDGKETGDQQRS